MLAFKAGQVISSPVTGTRYKIKNVLGEGGFGRAYLADELNRKNKPVDEVCVKTTPDPTSWHRESYFGELLSRSNRVIQMLDSFPIAPKAHGKMLYCLVLELAEHGTIADYLEKTGKPWTATRARREICALLDVLDGLHVGSATHRDITPMNIFVCGRGTLKLGDFGIARHELAGKPITIDAFNPAFVTRGFVEDEHRHWMAVDDVFQMGQLLAMLISGKTERTIDVKEVAALPCDDALKGIIKRAIGPRKRRYPDAFEMLQALRGDKTPTATKLRSLQDKQIVFTGPMTIKRFDAQVLALQAGGTTAKDVGKKTDVVVQGGRSPLYKSGHKGRKLQAAEKLIKEGHTVHIIGEAEFLKLAKPAKSGTKAKPAKKKTSAKRRK